MVVAFATLAIQRLSYKRFSRNLIRRFGYVRHD